MVIDLSDLTLSPDIQEQGGKIRLDFAKTQLPDALRVSPGRQDFATPVQFVNASAQSDRTSITIEPSGLYDYLVYQTDQSPDRQHQTDDHGRCRAAQEGQFRLYSARSCR